MNKFNLNLKINADLPFIVILIVSTLFSSVCSAQIYWNGSVSRSWGNQNNWDGAVPGPNDDVIIPDGAPRFPFITTPTSESVRSC